LAGQPGRDIYIIGNMASGKTTLARLLAESFPESVYVPEPVEQNPFLPLYMRDQPRWGLACMARYFLDYLRAWAVATSSAGYVYHFVDAGTPSNRWLYGRYLQTEHVISDDEYALYSDLCDAAAAGYQVPRPYAFIYVRATPQTCQARLQARGWAFQVAAVDSAYQEKLHSYLEQMAAFVIEQGYPLHVVASEEVDYARPVGQADVVALVAKFLQDAGSISHR
jgi:deoxyadenosine/deoxycytidine kinase